MISPGSILALEGRRRADKGNSPEKTQEKKPLTRRPEAYPAPAPPSI